MSHVRKQLRDEAQGMLLGLDTTADRVFQTRLYPLKDQLPAWTIFPGAEESENINMEGDLQRQHILILRGIAEKDSNIDATLDRMATEVESVIERTFGGLAKESALTGTDYEFSGEGEEEIGAIQLEYTILYITSRNDPETAL